MSLLQDINNSLNKHIDITFCIPVYNVVDYIENTILSIANQNFDGITYEILCIDDGSKDGSYEKIEELSKKYPTVRLLKNIKNSGISFTRNRLIKEAQGKYIWYIDSDDLLYKNAVNKVFHEIEKYQADVLYCDYIRFLDGTIENDDIYVFDNTKNARLIKDKEDLPVDSDGVKMNALWAGPFLRSFLIENKIWFNENVKMQEDTIFYWQFKMSTNKIYKIDSPVYMYRQRANSITHEGAGKRMKEQYVSMLEKLSVYEMWLDNGFYDDRSVLEEKIHLTKQGIVLALISSPDKKFIKKNLRELKNKKIYPYKFCKRTLREKGPLPLKILRFFVPFEPFLWIYHTVYKIFKK